MSSSDGMAAATTQAPSPGHSMEARTGRNNQRYNEQGVRLVAGVVPLDDAKKYVLLISTRRDMWVLPKGGWETDEGCSEAASREAWEEAGIEVQVDYDLGEIAENPPPADSARKDKARCLYHFFQATVTKRCDEWPEKCKRERRWFTYADAHEALAYRPELQEALVRSTMLRS